MNNNPFEQFVKQIFKEAHQKLRKQLKAKRDEQPKREWIVKMQERNERIDNVLLPVTKKSVQRKKLLDQKKRNEWMIQRFKEQVGASHEHVS